MEENKLEKLWEKIKSNLSDPEYRLKVAKAIGCVVALSAVSYIGYIFGYCNGSRDRFKADVSLLALMIEAEYIAIDSSKEDNFKELCRQRFIKNASRI